MILDLFKKKAPLDKASREALNQAQVQRARIDLAFDRAVKSIKKLSGAVNTIGKDRLVLDVYGLDKPRNLRGRQCACHFRIREGKTGVGFYGFRCEILDVRQAAHGGVVFVVSLPEKVSRSQRRRSMRVRPLLSWFEEVLFWNGAKRGESEADGILFGLRELKQAKLCRMENMSAGGMGLHFDREFCGQSEFRPEEQDEFTLYIRFAQDVRNQPRELWLTGKAVRVVEDRISRDVEVGVEFRHVGRKVQATGEMEWIAIKDNVAEELITRVFEWHAAMCRERSSVSQ